jgi:hypothetical protein
MGGSFAVFLPPNHRKVENLVGWMEDELYLCTQHDDAHGQIITGCRLYFHGGNVETYGTAESPAIGSQTWGLTDHPISTMVKKVVVK